MKFRKRAQWLGNLQLRNKIILMFIPLIVLPKFILALLSNRMFSSSMIDKTSSHNQNPFIALLAKDATEERGEVYGLSLVYSGGFLAQAEVD
ncbi:hypothetical protein VN24_16630 [Paenibacillus beijingensis]|uniref:Glycosyl hydrolase family 36 N-terminal domain-containing protein n=1 Tax=Paenibacillus beijingensis TaxID=1126833 RepID=A0A0D5NL64_9BACL|nr:hypothetical protein VN24_16630 [Paenibacillus beijingensis]